VDTAFVDERLDELTVAERIPADVAAAARAYGPVTPATAGPAQQTEAVPDAAAGDPWTTLTAWGR
jgi:hypothetical protein